MEAMMRQTMETSQQGAVGVQERPDDTHLRERLLDMAANRSPVVRNGRFYFSRDLNALTYWYEDHTESTRMVYIAAEG
jgi:hypothetical protein